MGDKAAWHANFAANIGPLAANYNLTAGQLNYTSPLDVLRSSPFEMDSKELYSCFLLLISLKMNDDGSSRRFNDSLFATRVSAKVAPRAFAGSAGAV